MIFILVFLICFFASIAGAICGIGGGVIIKPVLDAFGIMREQGLIFTTVTITAKEKICVMEQAECRPDKCERAKGHFDRVNECMYELLQNEDNRSDHCPDCFCRASEP